MKRHRKEALQLAAQQGHTAVTAYLLQQTTDWNDWITPLHRASFAGAVSTMRLLLDTAVEQNRLKALMRAPDITFGDQRNALHKAAAGGRFLAVHCLLEYYGQNTAFLLAKDGQGHTARDIAVAMRLRQIEEAKSVARWNTVAGGTPDWDKCVQVRASVQLAGPSWIVLNLFVRSFSYYDVRNSNRLLILRVVVVRSANIIGNHCLPCRDAWTAPTIRA
jgi:hypothetical protein